MAYPISTNHSASLFNCTPVGRALNSMMDPAYSWLRNFNWSGLDLVLSDDWSFVRGSTGGFLLLRYFSGVV